MKLAHIINPVKVSSSSDLYIAQPITFEAMRRARDFTSKKNSVELYACFYPEDASFVPDDFIATPFLEHAVTEYGDFGIPRKLPLMAEILQLLNDHSDADYFIYTNADIGLMPYFYNTVFSLINNDFDAFVINRRTLPDIYDNPEQLALIYSEAGKSHIGHDCFVFSRKIYQDLILENICIGAPFVGRAMCWNMAVHANNFKEFKSRHLTFHIGEDKPWKDDKYADYIKYNRDEAIKIIRKLKAGNNNFTKLEEHSLLKGMEFLNRIIKDE